MHYHITRTSYRLLFILIAAVGLYAANDVYAVKYYYVHPGLTTGLNNGSGWTNAWQSFTNVNWTQLSADADSHDQHLHR